MKNFIIFTTFILLTSCSANKNIKSELNSNLAKNSIQINSTSIEEARKLKPQIKPPIKIAVSHPRSSYKEWTLKEIKEIEAWLPKLKAAGLANDIVIIPSSLQSQCCENNLNDIRTAAAKLQADAVLVIGESTDTDSYLNPLSFLNITIIGMWLIPGHHRDSYVIFEASLIDTNNGYIYGIARGEGEAKMIRPFMYADRTTGQSEARLQALASLGNDIAEKANRFINKK